MPLCVRHIYAIVIEMLKAHNLPIANTAVAFNRLYGRSTRPPWDVDGPAPFVLELAERNAIRGEVLDAGCGTGENALYLAARGCRITAFDAAPTAIEKARMKAAERGIDIAFEVADARHMPYGNARFATVIDSGLFHVMARNADRMNYAEELRRVSLPGSVLHLLAFKERGPRWVKRLGMSVRNFLFGIGTHGVSEEEIQGAFSTGWCIDSVEEKRYGWGTFLLAHIRRV